METRGPDYLSAGGKKSKFMKPFAEFRWGYLVWLAAPLLLWLVLRNVAFLDVLAILREIKIWQILVLLLVNVGILMLFSSRWWLILRGMGYRLPFFQLAAYRTAGFGVSYFTPGPQFGGEPLQVALIGGRHGVPIPVAISSVYFDKLVELLANFTFLVVGLAVVLTSGILGRQYSQMGGVAFCLLFLLPTGHLIALWRGRTPATALFQRINRLMNRQTGAWPVIVMIKDAEEKMVAFIRQSPRILLQILVLSTFTWVMVVLEYVLLLRFLQIDATLIQAVIGLTATRIAFLLPLPGGIGALEAGQTAALSALGFPVAAGLSVSLLIRARDVFVGVLGLWIGASTAQSVWKTKKNLAKED